MKNCRKCLENLPFNNFYTSKKNKDGHQSYCKVCSCSNRVTHYKDNRENEKIVRKLYTKTIKDKFIDYKKTCFCSKCNENRWYILDFHHTENNKEYDVANMTNGRNSWETIMKEVNKCIVLCANCHREEHYFKKLTNK
jgi:hypothetical protein